MNTPNGARIESILKANSRLVAWAIVLVLLLDVLVAIRHGFDSSPVKKPNAGPSQNEPAPGTPGSELPGTVNPSVVPTVTDTGTVPGGTGRTLPNKPGTFIPGEGHIPFGVDQNIDPELLDPKSPKCGKNTLYLVYYWKGDRTMTSPYLGPTGQKGAVDEADAFRNFVAYVNKYATGGAKDGLMGSPFNLHGRTLCYTIYDAGQYDYTFESTAQSITDLPPFAAISSHGGLSDWICDALYKAKIFNISTYDLGRYPGGLYKTTNGYCLPQGLAWDSQVALSVSYLSRQAKTKIGGEDRVYGLLYADYPGLQKSVERLLPQLKAAGVNVATTYKLPTSLTDAAAGPATAAVQNFNKYHVNTVIAPDSGAPITFTHAAQARGVKFNYYVWPCSGEDATGQVRLYDPAQWAGAEGLSCYDVNWNLDLTLDNNARNTQWFHQYQEMAGRKDPPASSPLVYASFLPLLAGVTNAGRDLTVERFSAGMMAFRYPKGATRYDAINGPTNKASHFLIGLGSADGSQIGDVCSVRWDTTAHTQGNTTTGAYVYSDERYRPGHHF